MQKQPGFELFDSKGNFTFPTQEQIDTLDAATRERWEVVRDAHAACKKIEDQLTAAQERVRTLVREAADAQEYQRVHYGPQQRESALREYLATERSRYQ